ncbi:unnamed protein product, partial [Coregonus sp. 'balchen']
MDGRVGWQPHGHDAWCAWCACNDAITGIVADVFKNHNTMSNGTIPTSPQLLTHSTQKTKCLLRMVFVISPSTASILSMFLISLNRYVAIKLPLRYSQFTGRWTLTGALVALWMVSFTVGFLPGMARQLQQGNFDSSSLCTFFSVIRPRGIIVVFCAGFFPVLSVFTYFYLDILKIACGHQMQICQASSRLGPEDRGSAGGLFHPLLVPVLCGVLCEGCALYKVLENDLWLLGLSNSLINPLVYACWQREVWLQIGALFSCVQEHSLRDIPTHTVISVVDALSLDPTFTAVTSEEGHTVPLSATTL